VPEIAKPAFLYRLKQGEILEAFYRLDSVAIRLRPSSSSARTLSSIQVRFTIDWMPLSNSMSDNFEVFTLSRVLAATMLNR
jgi:hypothetical protein